MSKSEATSIRDARNLAAEDRKTVAVVRDLPCLKAGRSSELEWRNVRQYSTPGSGWIFQSQYSPSTP